ncbi:hypothetical protein [uncultured Parabacteroides sp.]|uniref:hypothetical protein n=1 Tax=uncultured Parabacteroides sp. TaxID=512312 RepID=UPI0026361553|nr:hypothetical protein [uncultured Parabacteroides sp.]
MSVFLISYCACDNEEENFDTATTVQVIKVPDDIKSFDSVTKEIIFEENVSIKQDVQGNEIVEFRIAGNSHFMVGSIPSISSVIYNAPVLLGDNQRYYLYDGYPVVDVLQNEVRNQEERDENMQKIEKAWNNFLKVLDKSGKLK